MHFLKKLLDFYIFSNIHVALAGFCLTKITLLKFGMLGNVTPIFVGLSIIVSYNFIRYYEIKTSRLSWFKDWFYGYKQWLLLLTVLSGFFLGYISFFSSFNLRAVFILVPFVFMTFFYAIPLFKIGKNEISFRNFPSIKIISIAIAWAGVTVFFPLREANYEFNNLVYTEFFQRFFVLLVITIPFDIRDVEVDSKQLKTLPQVFGINITKIIGTILLVLFVLLEFIKDEFSSLDIYILLLVSIVTVLFLWGSSPKKTRYYTSFWVESIPIIWLVIMMLFRNVTF